MHAIAAALITIAPMVGFQTGGRVDLNQIPTAVKPSAAYGITVSVDRERGRVLDIIVIDQPTRASRQDPFGEPLSARVNVAYIQIGGRYIFDPDARTQPYVAGTVGGTWLDIGGVQSVGPSGAIGGGADFELSRNVVLRLDGRFHITFGAGRASAQCDNAGTCSGGVTGGFVQFTGSAALAFRF